MSCDTSAVAAGLVTITQWAHRSPKAYIIFAYIKQQFIDLLNQASRWDRQDNFLHRRPLKTED